MSALGSTSQYLDPHAAGTAMTAAFGVFVTDGDGYSLDPTGTPDAFLVDDGAGYSLDPTGPADARVLILGGHAEIL